MAPDLYVLRSARYLAREAAERVVRAGDFVIDATMGNGHDTAWLCELVGESGRVFAFDVQEKAVQNTRERLTQAGLIDRAALYLAGHEAIKATVPSPVRLVLFNLGWLPGSDKSVRTKPETTLAAVRQALDCLLPLGICVVCIYPGHPEGKTERQQLLSFFSALAPQRFNVLRQVFLNAGDDAPECIIIQKQEEKP